MAMLHRTDFFQEQINQCRRLAEQASNKNDRQFWLKMMVAAMFLIGMTVGSLLSAHQSEPTQTVTMGTRG